MSDQEATPKRSNRLLQESSPYLQQHAYNPVDWYPWGSEAFEKAQQEGKPIFLSVGYSACHWCHVMEHESFENAEIARILNEHYISIKVDREERPDVDQIYMAAVQLITKRGGWPMSVFMTPEGKPFYGGTYWPPAARMGMPGFRDILLKLVDYWHNKREEVDTSATQLVEAIQEMAAPVFEKAELGPETLLNATKALLRIADRKHGGFGGAPKFPHPMDLRLLLRGWKRFHEQAALETATFTLHKMLNGGIYDHLGGGFHRYSTDAYWLAPHFEKMLYDNALLVPAYLEAWQATGNSEFRRIVTETLDYVLAEMTAPAGGFFSTQDADSEGEEGKFFVWSETEIVATLGAEGARLFNAVYDVAASGNWEGKTILNRPTSLGEVSRKLNVSVAELTAECDRGKKLLKQVRSQRITPGRDEKILVSWNGMMITAMAQAGFALNDSRYLTAAKRAAAFVLEHLRDEKGKLLHAFKDERARFQAYLDDYACLIEGLIELYQGTGEESLLQQAILLAEEMIEGFWDPVEQGFYFTANDHESLIARTKDIQDNAVPSGNGMAATVLVRLGRLCGREDFVDLSRKTIEAFSHLLVEHPRACGQSLLALDEFLGPNLEVVVVSSDATDLNHKMLGVLREVYMPGVLRVLHTASEQPKLVTQLVQGKVAGETGIRVYLCVQGECRVPAATVEQLQQQLSAWESRLS